MFNLNPQKSLLLIIDIQERLCASMGESELEICLKNTKKLIAGCSVLGVPIVQSLQYVKGLGNSVAGLFAHENSEIPHIDFEKKNFSCYYKNSALNAHLVRNPQICQIIIAGMEAHVCVLQTARDLRKKGFEVIVASDCVISRRESHKNNALSVLIGLGAVALNFESILFDLLKTADASEFKAISKIVK